MKKSRIVFSTTKQWNPGDELILHGIRNLLGEHVFIMFNRHPFISFNNRVGDNSYYFGMGDEIIDHAIFAGSPEYQTQPNYDMYRLIAKQKIPFSYIGVGGMPFVKGIPFHKATVKIVRDSLAANIEGSTLLPCPSIYANKTLDLEPVKKKVRIGFCYQSILRYICSPSQTLNDLCVKFIEEYKPLVICHSYVDYVEAEKNGWDCFYSANYHDYKEVYSKLDLLVGTRIHGSGWCASMGIPSILIPHDERWETGQNLGANIFNGKDFSDLVSQFEQFDVEKESKRIIQLRKDTFPKYMSFLEPVFGTPSGWEK